MRASGQNKIFLSPFILFAQPVIATVAIMLILGAPLENAPIFLLKFSLVFALPVFLTNYVSLLALQQKAPLTRKQIIVVNICCHLLQLTFFLAYFIPTFLQSTEPVIMDFVINPDGNITQVIP